jgi:hypothetical protein
MLSELAIGCGCIVERVVGPVHEGVLAEHGSHFCGFEDVDKVAVRRWKVSCTVENSELCSPFVLMVGSGWVVGLRLQAVE